MLKDEEEKGGLDKITKEELEKFEKLEVSDNEEFDHVIDNDTDLKKQMKLDSAEGMDWA